MKLFLVMILESKYKVFLHTRRGQTRVKKNSTELRQNFVDNRISEIGQKLIWDTNQKFDGTFRNRQKLMIVMFYEPKIRRNFEFQPYFSKSPQNSKFWPTFQSSIASIPKINSRFTQLLIDFKVLSNFLVRSAEILLAPQSNLNPVLQKITTQLQVYLR